jgi:hypothetical protein
MGDRMMRISLLVQRGVICQRCGCEVAGEMTGSPRSCADCAPADASGHEPGHQRVTAMRDSPKRSANPA